MWFPRELQGAGRHDNPARYGCVYAAERLVSAVAEALARFRGTGRLAAAMLLRGGLELALAELRLDEEAELVDLDSPQVLADVRLPPSEVATNVRAVTQAQAERIFDNAPTSWDCDGGRHSRRASSTSPCTTALPLACDSRRPRL